MFTRNPVGIAGRVFILSIAQLAIVALRRLAGTFEKKFKNNCPNIWTIAQPAVSLLRSIKYKRNAHYNRTKWHWQNCQNK